MWLLWFFVLWAQSSVLAFSQKIWENSLLWNLHQETRLTFSLMAKIYCFYHDNKTKQHRWIVFEVQTLHEKKHSQNSKVYSWTYWISKNSFSPLPWFCLCWHLLNKEIEVFLFSVEITFSNEWDSDVYMVFVVLDNHSQGKKIFSTKFIGYQ